MKERRWLRMLRTPLAAAVVLVLSVLIEGLFFNRHALFQECYEKETAIETGSLETRLDLKGERYVKTVSMELDVEETVTYRLILLDGQGNTISERAGSISPKLDMSVINLRAEAAELVLVFPEAVSADGLMTAANFMEWSPHRLFFLASMFGLAAFLWMGRHIVSRKPEYAFAVIALTAGLQIILMTGTNQISYDEQTHISKTWNLSYIGTVYDTEAVLELKTLTVPEFHNRFERIQVESYLQGIHDYETADVYRQTKMIYYDRRAYLPMAVCIAAARIMKLPFAVMLMAGKFGNLLMYTAVCFFAVRKAKQKKGLVAVIALLPNSIFSASQFCYDACVNSFLLLAMVLTANEFFTPKERVRPRNMAAILLCLIVGSYAKPVYMLMGLVLLFLGNDKFPSKRAAWMFRAAFTVLCLSMVYEVLGKSAVGGSVTETLAHAGDIRTEGANMLGQIRHIFGAPFSYAWQLLSSMFVRIADWFTGKDQFLMYAYLGTPGTLCTWIFFAAVFFSALYRCPHERQECLSGGNKALFVIMVFGMSAVVWTVLYLSFNTVGSPVIDGVQNRYFTPVLFPFFICLANRRLVWKRSGESYHMILFTVMTGLLLYTNFRLGMMPYYL